MTLAVIVPVKGLGSGKSRLDEILAGPERAALNRAFLMRTLDVVARFDRGGRCIVVSSDDDVLEIACARGAAGVRERAADLNAAIADAVSHAESLGTRDILVISVDLPRLEVEDLESMSLGAGIALAPDRGGRGTNAIYLPDGARLSFAYGEGSFASHLASARATGRPVRIVRRPGLAFDVDTPEDYREWLSDTGTAG
jgi:2-phospho-L-lactate guanylyltransferase